MTESKTSKERPSARTMRGTDCAEQGISKGGRGSAVGCNICYIKGKGGGVECGWA